MTLTNTFKDYFFIITLSIFCFVPFLGNVHLFDWDEINFAESAREMLVTGDYLNVQINYKAFWEKPPLFIWIQALSMHIFGVNEFAARFPNAMCGIVSLLFLYHIGKLHFSRRFGLLWVLIYAGSILPHFYFKSGIIDPWFNLFTFIAIERFAVFANPYASQNSYQNLIFSAIFIGLAVLTKGPVALLVFLFTGMVYLILTRFKMAISFGQIMVYIFVSGFVGGFWFLLQILFGNFAIIKDFVLYQIRLFSTQDAGHGGFLLYHFVVLLFGVFPASFFAIGAMRPAKEKNTHTHLKLYMTILLGTVLVLFTIVKTKIVHYSSLCYFPLTFLASYYINLLIEHKKHLSKLLKIVLLSFSVLLAFAVIGLSFIDIYKHSIIPLIKDRFARHNLYADGKWLGFEFVTGLVLLIGIFYSILYLKHNLIYSIVGIFISSLIFVNLTMTLIVPRIEEYSQNAAIEFYKSHLTEECYIETLGFKSYAHIFYFQKPKPKSHEVYSEEELLLGKANKTVYFVSKIHKFEHYIKHYPNLTKLYEKNGFVFLTLQNTK